MFAALSPDQQLDSALRVHRSSLAAAFYKNKYEQAGAAPTDLASWQRLPLLTKQELFDNAYPRSRGMLTAPVREMIVLSTGGSSGVARYTLLTHDEWDLFCDMQAAALELLGVRPDDRVANLFVAGHLWPSFIGVHEVLKRVKAVHLPISANIAPEEIMRLCLEFDPTVMLSLPTLFVFLADIAQKEGRSLPSLRLLCYAGEHMSEQAQQHVRTALQVDEIKALAYSSADAGLMGYQCSCCSFATYHVPTGFQFIEIIHPDTLEPAPPGAQGDLIVTNLGRVSLPIIRYRVGDVATFLVEPCKCGDPNPLLRLEGRAGDDFKLGGAFISMGVFEESVATVTDVASMNYRIVLEDVGNQMDIRLDVESADPQCAREAADRLRDAVLERVPEMRVGLELDYIRSFAVEFVELGALPRNPRTGKVKRLEDRRAKSPDAGEKS